MLVSYSDSDSDVQEAPRAKRRKQLQTLQSKIRSNHASPPPPPPPASFYSLYATNVRTAAADDPSLHGGRTRQVAHVEGNWPSHIYLEWTPSKDHLQALENVVEHCRVTSDKTITAEPKVHSLLRSDLSVQLPLHISLSAPLTLQTEQKDDFAAAVAAEVTRCGASSFSVHPLDISWVSNFDRTRTFLVLKLSKPANDDMNKLLQACNKCAGDYDLELLYQPKEGKKADRELGRITGDLSTTFHISIAWTLQAVEDLAHPGLAPALLDEVKNIVISFDTLKLKIGNVVTSVDLQK